jgi:hypothetical protein
MAFLPDVISFLNSYYASGSIVRRLHRSFPIKVAKSLPDLMQRLADPVVC